MAQSFNEDPIFKRVKSVLIQGSGMEGLKEAVRTFRLFDTNGDNELDPSEWRSGLKKMGVKLTDTEANYLFIAFDLNKDGLVSIDEFVRNLIGQMNPRRTRVVDRAFEKFQMEGGPNVTVSKRPHNATVGCDALMSTFTATSRTNPLVQSGAKSEAQLIKEFAMIFDESRNPNGTITKEEFTGYYAAISTTVPFDDVFEAMVLKAWGIDDAAAPRLGTTMRQWGEKGDPLQLDNPLLHTNHLQTRLADTLGSKAYDSTHMTRNHPPFTPNPSVLPDYISTTKKTYVPYDEQQRLAADPMSTRRGNGGFEPTATMARAMAASKGPSSGVIVTGNPIIDTMRKKILSNTADEGFVGLRRSFYVMDVAPSKVLAKLEARAALQRFKISVTPIEFEQLWNVILKECADGVVTVRDFLRVLRGDCLNGARIAAIRMAFEHLIASGCGTSADCLSLPAISQIYNTNELPTVRTGARTRAAALQDFVNSFSTSDVGPKGDRLDEFLFTEYYEDASAGIDDDITFELLIRNAWRIK